MPNRSGSVTFVTTCVPLCGTNRVMQERTEEITRLRRVFDDHVRALLTPDSRTTPHEHRAAWAGHPTRTAASA